MDLPKGRSADCAYGVTAVIRGLLVVVWNNIFGGGSIDGCEGGTWIWFSGVESDPMVKRHCWPDC